MKEPINRWVLIFILFVLVVAWNYLVGCAELPLCVKWQYGVHEQGGRLYYVLDENNAVKMIEMVEGLSKGTCRLD